MREAVERAETEGKIEVIQKQLNAATLRAAELERKHAEELTTMHQKIQSQSAMLKQSTVAVEKTRSVDQSRSP